MPERILTPEQRQAHIDTLKKKYPNHPDIYFELVGDSATFHSNQEHDPLTGFHKWKPNTPTYVLEVAARYLSV